VLTSRNAVRAFALWPRSDEWRNRPLFVTGAATMRAARAAGFTDIHPAAGDSASLAELITSMFRNDVGPVLYPAPRDRSGALLLEQLGSKGYDVQMIEAYRAEPARRLNPKIVAGLRSGQIEGVLLYSLRTAKTFRTLAEAVGLSKKDLDFTFFTLSSRIAEVLSGWAKDVRIARNPDEASLFDLLQPAAARSTAR
jgi:uroporphyrinogen-III synthase